MKPLQIVTLSNFVLQTARCALLIVLVVKQQFVNRASLHELLLDYEDYLRVRGLEQWKYDDPRCIQARAFCKAHLDSAVYREKIKERSDETIANIAITLIHQCDVLIRGLIEWKKRDFKERGGIKEEMYRARREWQQRNGYNGRYGTNGQPPNNPIKPNSPKE